MNIMHPKLRHKTVTSAWRIPGRVRVWFIEYMQIGICLAVVLCLLDRSVAGLPQCTFEIALLDDDHQSDGCHYVLRPRLGLDEDDDDEECDDDRRDESCGDHRKDDEEASFTIAARTQVDPSAALIADASGSTGKVYIGSDGAGVRRTNCSGNGSVSGNGSDQDEELVFSFDTSVAADSVSLQLRQFRFESDSIVLFVKAEDAATYDHVVTEDEIRSAYTPTGSQEGTLNFAGLSAIPSEMRLDAFKLRAIAGHFYVGYVATKSGCDDGNPCTFDSCADDQCVSKPKPAGSACGDASDTDCTDPDTCDGAGNCQANDASDGTPCADGLKCTGTEVCGSGICGPDMCGQFNGGCNGNEWSCTSNWTFGGVYPNNSELETFSVVLDGIDDVFLDISVAINALTLIENAILHMTQTGLGGDLTLVSAGGLDLKGRILIDNGRVLDASGAPVIIGPGGLFALEPNITRTQDSESTSQARAPGEGTFIPGDLTLTPGTTCPPDCPPQDGGTLILSANMTLSVQGDLVIDGSTASPCGAGGGLRGVIIPPPKFRTADMAQTSVTGDLDINGSVDLFHASTNNLTLGGDFNNHGNVPPCFDWTQGGLTLNSAGPQNFEVAGRDFGPARNGFRFGGDTNFAIGRLEVAAGRNITFRNSGFNTVGTAACQEALYVRDLILRSGSTILLDDCRVYYETLIQEPGVSVVSAGCGALQQGSICATNADCADGDVCTDDICDFALGQCANVPIASLAYGDVAYSGEGSVVDVDDILCVLAGFSGFFGECPLERVDLVPCSTPTCTQDADCEALNVPCTNGLCHVLDVDDILAVLDAFTGFDQCPARCP